MGYFSNGSEGLDYQAQYCDRCVHWSDEYGCPCWQAHETWNYDECNNKASLLHRMIPRTKDGLGNGPCFAFLPNDMLTVSGGQKGA
jgi:hypothetical protein